MAGEYYRWLARDVKPPEKRELTPAEKRRNWWAYHKWHLAAGLVCLVMLVSLISDMVRNSNSKPDYVIAYVGTSGNSTGYHLHFEVRKDGVAVNPMQFFTAA